MSPDFVVNRGSSYKAVVGALLCFVLLVGFLGTNAACSGQDKTKQRPDLPETQLDRRTMRPIDNASLFDKSSEQKFDIIFQKPMSVEDFVAYLRNKTGDKLNIVIGKRARKVMVPPIELRQVSIISALNAMTVATEAEIIFEGGDDEVIQIHRDPELANSIDKDSATSVRVFNVSHIVNQNDKAERSMLSAIEIGLEMGKSSPENVDMKFHEETKLLFIRASRSDLDIVMQVLDQIGAGSTKSRSEYDDYGDDGMGMDYEHGSGGE